MCAPADYVEALALRLAHEHGHRAEACELAVKGLDFAEWHGVLPNAWPSFVRVFCSECNRLGRLVMNKIAGLKIKINERDFPLVRGGKFPKEALRWLAEVERVFPGATKDIIIIRNSSSAPLREAETGESPIAQESKSK